MAFYGCNNLENIIIPSSVHHIGDRAFYDCTNLNVVIFNSEKDVNIGEDAFQNCKSVTYLTENQEKDETENNGNVIYYTNGSAVIKNYNGEKR